MFGFEAQVGAVLPTCVGIAIVNVGLTFAAITVIMVSTFRRTRSFQNAHLFVHSSTRRRSSPRAEAKHLVSS